MVCGSVGSVVLLILLVRGFVDPLVCGSVNASVGLHHAPKYATQMKTSVKPDFCPVY